jgi:hypothetical protein
MPCIKIKFQMMKPKKLTSPLDRLHDAFDKQFERVHNMNANENILPDRFTYNEDDERNCNYRAEFVARWDQVCTQKNMV